MGENVFPFFTIIMPIPIPEQKAGSCALPALKIQVVIGTVCSEITVHTEKIGTVCSGFTVRTEKIGTVCSEITVRTKKIGTVCSEITVRTEKDRDCLFRDYCSYEKAVFIYL